MKYFATLIVVFATFSTHAQAQTDKIKGFLEPYRSIDVAASEMGTLASVTVEEGHKVRKGDILAQMDTNVLKASRAIAANGREAQGKLNSAKAELQMQIEKLQKIRGLYERNHATRTELDRIQGQVNVSEAQMDIVLDELKQKELEVARIDAQIEQRLIRTPIDGIVTRVFKDIGEFVSPSEPTVATVVQLDPLVVVFLVPQDYASRFKTGQKIEIEIGLRKKKTAGVVEFVSPVADAQSSTCRMKVVLPNKRLVWESGMVAFLNLGQ